MSILDDLKKESVQVKEVLDGDATIVTAEDIEKDSELKKFTPLGEDIDESNVSEDPEDGMLPIYKEDADEDIILSANSFEIVNEDYHEDFKYVRKVVYNNGSITTGNSTVIVSSDVGGTKLLGISLTINDDWGTAPGLITIAIRNSALATIYTFTVLDAVGTSRHLFDSFNFDDKIETPQVLVTLSGNAVSDGNVDVAFIYETIEGGDWR